MEVLRNVVKCVCCSNYLQYNESDITKTESTYNVGTYAGETYIAKRIECPICHNKIEIY